MNVFIVLVNWNNCLDTLACIESLYSMEYSPFQIIVVDNASSDGSVEKIRKIYPNLILLESNKNLGFGGGNNIGIKYALENGADFVWLLNNDTVVSPSSLSKLVQYSLSKENVGAVGSVLYYMSEPTKIQAWGGGKVNMYRGMSFHYEKPVKNREIQYLTGASILLPRDSVEKVGLLDESFFMYWEDTDYCFKLRKAGYRLFVASESIVLHKVSSSTGRKSGRYYYLFNRSAALFFKRHSRYPLFPLLVGIVDRFFRRILQGEYSNSICVLKGFWAGVINNRIV